MQTKTPSSLIERHNMWLNMTIKCLSFTLYRDTSYMFRHFMTSVTTLGQTHWIGQLGNLSCCGWSIKEQKINSLVLFHHYSGPQSASERIILVLVQAVPNCCSLWPIKVIQCLLGCVMSMRCEQFQKRELLRLFQDFRETSTHQKNIHISVTDPLEGLQL